MHLDTYIELLITLRDAKSSASFTNIESNVYQGLQDIPTLTELAVLALYAQSVSSPYMRYVRSSGLNALDLGLFHDGVKQHCRHIIQSPDLLLALDGSGATGSLDGLEWDRPEVIYRVLCLAPRLPNLRPMLVSFFRGALATWERFTSEFSAGGIISRATPEQRHSAWITPTNDVSEGALGRCRQMLRRAPTMTDEQRNARTMWKYNNTYSWARQTLTNADQVFVRSAARALDSSKNSHKVRMELNTALEERAKATQVRQGKAKARRSAKEERLAEVQLLEEARYEDLASMKVRDLDAQIDKLREGGDKSIRAKSTIGNKQAKIKEILDGFERRRRNITVGIASEEGGLNLPAADITTGEISDNESVLEDAEMCFNDEVLL